MRQILAGSFLTAASFTVGCSQSNAIVTRDYDVRTLTVTLPDFTDAPDLRVSNRVATTEPTSLFETASCDGDVCHNVSRAADLLRATKVILAGVPSTSADEHDGILRVVAPADAQRRVQKAVEAALADYATQMTIGARVTVLPMDLIATLDHSLREKIDYATIQDRKPALLTDSQATDLLRATQSNTQANVTSYPRITLFQGQRAYVMTSTQKAYVAGYTPSTGADGKGKYDPELRIAESGFVLDVRATASADRSSVSLDLRTQLAQVLSMQDRPWTFSSPQQMLKVQVPEQRIQQTDRLITLPAGRWALLRVPDTDSAHADLTKMTFVLLQAQIIDSGLLKH